jgi:peptidoglycan/xylan/chitin deacetylase (PgdA/CDA1 family)
VSAWNTLLPAARTLRRRRSLILSYHGVAESNARVDPEFLRVSPAAFRGQLEVLLRAGFEIVTVADLAARANGAEPPPGMVALSFDDGMDDNHAYLLPILRDYGVPASVYVATGLVGKASPWMAPGTSRMMTEDELFELHAAGVELGAHTVTHPNLEELGYDECLQEMTASRDFLHELTGAPIRTFAYPFCKYSADAVRAARDAGFEAAVTCHWRGSWDPFEMKRVMITGKDGPPSFGLKAWELYGRLFHSAPGRLARTTTRSVRRRIRAARETAAIALGED